MTVDVRPRPLKGIAIMNATTLVMTKSVNFQFVIVPAKQRGFAVMRKKVRVDVDRDETTADLEVR